MKKTYSSYYRSHIEKRVGSRRMEVPDPWRASDDPKTKTRGPHQSLGRVPKKTRIVHHCSQIASWEQGCYYSSPAHNK
jgi:hypothetical protein